MAGLTWILSDEVVYMRDVAWNHRFKELLALTEQTGTARVDPYHHSESLRDWLEHQKALLALGEPSD